VLIFKDLFTLYNKVRSKGDSGDVRLTDYYNNKNDNSSNNNVNKGYDGNSSVNKGYNTNNINKKVAGEAVECFT